MKICIPTLDDSGLEARISDHFGSAPFYTIVDSDAESIAVISNGQHGDQHTHAHGQGGCRALQRINPDLCGGHQPGHSGCHS